VAEGCGSADNLGRDLSTAALADPVAMSVRHFFRSSGCSAGRPWGCARGGSNRAHG